MTILTCDLTGTCVVKNMPLLCQSDARIDDDVELKQGPTGCYDASIMMVALTALANRAGLPAVAGRTKALEGIQATDTIPKRYKQLSWGYRNAMNVKPYYFHELIADFGPTFGGCIEQLLQSGVNNVNYSSCGLVTSNFGASFKDWVGEETHVNNAYIKQLMDAGFVVMIAYRRYTPTGASFNNSLGGWVVRLEERALPHKVVFSGYQSSTYPLRINDVGRPESQSQRRVRLQPGLIGRGYGHADAVGDKIKSVDTFPFMATRFHLEHEDEANPAPAHVVNLIEHIDAISLEWRPPRVVWTGRWATGWSHFMPFTVEGKNYFMAYNKADGTVHFDRVSPNLNGSEGLWSGRWGAGWSHFMPFAIGSNAHFVAYNTVSGSVHFDQVWSNLLGSQTLWSGTWSSGCSQLVPVPYSGLPHFTAYHTNGAMHFERIRTGGKSFDILKTDWLSPGVTSVMPFLHDGKSYQLFYNASTGDVQIHHFMPL